MKEQATILNYDVTILAKDLKDINTETKIGQWNNIISHRMSLKDYDGDGIVVGVCDTGIDIEHEFIRDNILGGKNFVYNERELDWNIANNYHATGVVSCIVAVAPNVKILLCKCMDTTGNGYLEEIATAVDYCVSQGVDMINLSIGSKTNNNSLEVAVKNAVKSDIPIIVALGNNGDGNANTDEISYPSAFGEVISVSSMTKDYEVSDFSNSNNFCDFVAVGTQIRIAYPRDEKGNSRYARTDGTSFACPTVVGFACLLMEKFKKEVGRKPSESELFGLLCKHAREVEDINYVQQGNGYIDLNIRRIKRI